MDATVSMFDLFSACQTIYRTLYESANDILVWLDSDMTLVTVIFNLFDALPDWFEKILDPSGLLINFKELADQGVSPIGIMFGIGIITMLGWAFIKFIWPTS